MSPDRVGVAVMGALLFDPPAEAVLSVGATTIFPTGVQDNGVQATVAIGDFPLPPPSPAVTKGGR